ncbi:MAG: hypothetical protein NC078_04585 [Ruminococcus sp.]|nr:hypothetical protein [Ruminococcus sp.]
MNNIVLAKKYSGILDEVYMENACTAALESERSLASQGANANEIIIPVLDMDGMADYSRNDGYVKGDVSLTWQTAKFNYERGRMFAVDEMDDEETRHLAFGSLAGRFVKTKAVPELDAFRFAQLASCEGIFKKEGELETGEDAAAALREALNAMDDAQVPSEERILFITPMLKGLIDDMDTTRSRAVMAGVEKIVVVPKSRFYTKIKLFDGVSEGEKEGGYKKADDGKDINFMIVHKPAVLQFTKTAVPKIISPANNPDADSWKYGYRSYGLCKVYENKTAGIYCHSRG